MISAIQFRRFLKVIIFWAMTSGACLAQSLSHPFIPQQGRLLIIGQQRDSIGGYIENIGVIPGGFMVYTSIQNVDGLDAPSDHGGGINDAKFYIDSYPHIAVQLGLYMVGALNDILKGQYDGNIIKLAEWMKNTGCPIYLRIGYEFDYPDNNYDHANYVQAYRYIVDHLRAQGVDNVAYVWHSAAMMESQGNFMNWYPGDDYVDWFAVSFFNPSQIDMAKKFFALGRQHNKPLMIAESSPIGISSIRGKLDWFRQYFDFINDEGVQVVCYINSDWDLYPMYYSLNWGDTRVETHPEIKTKWKNEIKDGYIGYSLNMFKNLNGD